ncbi:hypothetical protein MGG_15846 [Pyricularia oryzae 70-15]|uniref:Uncharacterized protein n=3 Tax=Pyricularia oryzae TaxID=318829 RepID=G4MZS4_PYRO7|nr:uncharacterized protein MGG_15846 [Pyricularia oryzae 70-15]EHA55438.1 hypothetical protein MGG_15846 [Pyricularia oryzae 70-15]ELQ35473.1 hypothetical protein OOU_Y34scaffold00707g57 [Pyricularia oryzae Y34]
MLAGELSACFSFQNRWDGCLRSLARGFTGQKLVVFETKWVIVLASAHSNPSFAPNLWSKKVRSRKAFHRRTKKLVTMGANSSVATEVSKQFIGIGSCLRGLSSWLNWCRIAFAPAFSRPVA